MEKSLFEQMGGTYTQVGDYLLPDLILSPEEKRPIGVWGQRYARYLKLYHKILYYNLLTRGQLNTYLAEIDKKAEELLFRIAQQMAKGEGMTEQLNIDD